MSRTPKLSLGIWFLGMCGGTLAWSEPFYVHRFERTELTDVYYSEGANTGEINGGGPVDAIHGPWSHHTQNPMGDAGAVVYGSNLVHGAEGVEWIPFHADGDWGTGRQITVNDVNADGLPDLVGGGMRGCQLVAHDRQVVEEEESKRAQPQKQVKAASGLTPEEAAERMTVPDGFHVTLAAAEPDIHQPIAFALDPRGRLWVAEAYTYPVRAPEGQGRDKIVILEDTTGDGRLDHRKVFCEGLNLVSGLEVGFGGVWIGAAPYLLFIPDRDADDRPDSEPQVLLDGFGYQDTHETLNSFNWGPDGWLYGCHGVFTHSRVGKPGTPDAERQPMNAAVWRYHPVRHAFEVFAWGTSNPWGVDFDDRGQPFLTACVIPHLYYVVQGARYQRQGGNHFNPHVFDDIKTIADHAHYAGDIRDHAWWGQEPALPKSTSDAGGGHAHAGAMIYLGDNWPDRYRNQLFMCNIHGNRVNNDYLVRSGSGFLGRHGDDFLFANDHWFRGINLKYGPDGGVYLIDWYDRHACHRRDPEIWDRTNGRVYKITYGSPEFKKLDLAKRSDAELVELLTHRNDWYVRMARRLLQERGKDAAVREALRDLLQTAGTEPIKLRALWALHCVGGVDESIAHDLLDSSDEYVRAWTIQLQLEDREVSSGLRAQFEKMAKSDASPVVRLYLASALQRMPYGERWPILERLVQRAEDAEDHNLPLMIWYATEPLVLDDPDRAMALAQRSRIPQVTRYIFRRAASDNSLLDAVVALLANPRMSEDRRLLILEEILQAFEGRVGIPVPKSWGAVYEQLSNRGSADVRDRADRVAVLLGDQRVFPRMRSLLLDEETDLEQRREALNILVRGRDKGSVAAFQALLEDRTLRRDAIRALAAFYDASTPEVLIERYPEFQENERRDAIATLVSNRQYATALLDAIEQGEIPRSDLHAYHVRQLLRVDDDEIRRRINDVWGTTRETPAEKQRRIDSLEKKLTAGRLANADVSQGRRLFNKSCAACHVLFGEGGKVGPDLTGSNRTNVRYILENVVDPSAVLGKDYRMTIVQTSEGQIVSGLVQFETDSGLTLHTLNDTVVVAKSDIEDRSLSQLSLMPDGLFDQMSDKEIRDLVAYLGSPRQVPLRGPSAPIDSKTGQVPGAREAETLKILTKSAGTVRTQQMASFTNDRWSGSNQLWWTGARPGARLEWEVPIEEAGRYTLEIVLTRARDYAVVQLTLDGKPLGGPIDLFNAPDVITTGVLAYEGLELTAGAHALGIEILGANPKAEKAFMVGLDYVRLQRE